MKKFLAVAVVVLLGAAYVGGYWPQRQARKELEGRMKALEAQTGTLQGQLSDAQARVRMGALLGHLLTLIDLVAEKNYGHARTLASSFFDAVRAESDRAQAGGGKEALEAVLAARDEVTAGLTRGDAAVVEPLRKSEARLRQALGYPMPPAPPPGATVAPATTAETSAPPG